MNETIAQLLRSQPLDAPGLVGLLDSIRDTAAELGELARQEGDAAVWDRIGELPALGDEFRAWADAVLDPPHVEPVYVEEEESARARAIREQGERTDPETGDVGESVGSFLDRKLRDDHTPGDEATEETARARAIREAAESDKETCTHGVSLNDDCPQCTALPENAPEGETARARAIREAIPEGTDVPFPRGTPANEMLAADVSDGPSSGGDSDDPSAVPSGIIARALTPLGRRLEVTEERLRQLDEITGNSLGDIRDRLRKLEGRPGVPPVSEAAEDGTPEEVQAEKVDRAEPTPEADRLKALAAAQDAVKDGEDGLDVDPPETTSEDPA